MELWHGVNQVNRINHGVLVFCSCGRPTGQHLAPAITGVLPRSQGQEEQAASGSGCPRLFRSFDELDIGLVACRPTPYALAMDATTLGERFSVLAISVVYRGCAIQVAWQVVRADTLVPYVGSSYAAQGSCFKTQPLECTMLGQWEEGYNGPWLIVTDLPPDEAAGQWYAMRAWIECGFRHTKRGGWQWQNTKMTVTERAVRRWLTITFLLEF